MSWLLERSILSIRLIGNGKVGDSDKALDVSDEKRNAVRFLNDTCARNHEADLALLFPTSTSAIYSK